MTAAPTTEDLVSVHMELLEDCENTALRGRLKDQLAKSYSKFPVAAKQESMESLRELQKIRGESKPTPSDDPLDPENIRKKLLEVYMKLMMPENKDMLQLIDKNMNENITDDAKSVISGITNQQRDFLERHNLQHQNA